MDNDTNEQLNIATDGQRNNIDEAALLEVEEKIKTLAFKDQPASESFRNQLKAKILASRQQHSMKFFTVKFMIPAVAFVFVLAFALGTIYFKYTGSSSDFAFLNPEGFSVAKIWQKISGKNSDQLAMNSDNNESTVGGADLYSAKMMAQAPMAASGIADSVSPEMLTGGITSFKLSLVQPVFAQAETDSPQIKPSLSGEKVAVSALSNFAAFEKSGTKFSGAQKQMLESDNFLETINPLVGDQTNGMDDFTDTYSSLSGSGNMYYREPQNAVFITSDLALHVYHVLVDRSFQKLEETKLQPMLLEMTRALFEDSVANYNETTDPVLKNSYERLAAFYLIPLVILEKGTGVDASNQLDESNYSSYAEYMEAVAAQQDASGEEVFVAELPTDNQYNGIALSDNMVALVSEELALINKQDSPAGSPFFSPYRPDFVNDYTQFKPRSHYTKNNILKSYFEAMMWYGRMGFTLNNPELTREALLMTGQVNTLGDGELAKKWGDMSSVIDFFVGQSDDLTPLQFTVEMKKLYGAEMPASGFVSDVAVDKFISGALKDLPSPRILSEIIDITGRNVSKEDLLKETLQFRFMGQRFTPDAYVLNQFTQGAELADKETKQKLPSMPTALMPMSIIKPDNKTVKNYLDSWVVKNAPQSDKIIAKVYDKLKLEFSQYNPGVWTQNMYWNWLDALRIVLGNYGEGYPYFMKTISWQKKSLGTALGSYTELKHDTLLYAKQSYAERGGGGADDPKLPPVPKGYVEPDLAFWNKVIQLSLLTQKGLASRDMLPEGYAEKYGAFEQAAIFCRELVQKELQNKKISDDDFEKLRVLSSSFSSMVVPLEGSIPSTKDRRAGIIVDIHTDGLRGQILYEATGKPNLIFTAVKDVNGTRLTVGAVYNHYEFAGPLGERLSDEDWQKNVYEGKEALPTVNDWIRDIVK